VGAFHSLDISVQEIRLNVCSFSFSIFSFFFNLCSRRLMACRSPVMLTPRQVCPCRVACVAIVGRDFTSTPLYKLLVLIIFFCASFRCTLMGNTSRNHLITKFRACFRRALHLQYTLRGQVFFLSNLAVAGTQHIFATFGCSQFRRQNRRLSLDSKT